MLRAVSYSRFSTDMQREESIEAQERAIREYCDRNGFAYVGGYADRGLSGKSDKRPEFLRMISDSASNLFDVVLVHKLDRFSRDRYNSAVYKNILKKNGVRLVSVLENFQDTPESVILESVIEGMNEYYSLNLSREVRKGLQENALACMVTGGPPALGYSVDESTKRYVINETEAEAVRMIFNMYNDGYSYGEIIGALNRGGYKTRRGAVFGKNSLHSILRNVRYTGDYVYVKDSSKNPAGKYVRHGIYDPEAVIRIPGGMPMIIERSLFDSVQRKMNDRKRRSGQFRAKQEYLLSGKIFCGKCGSPYSGCARRPFPGHPMFVSYRCTRHNQKIKCTSHEIKQEFVENAVIEKLTRLIFDSVSITEMIEEYNKHLEEAERGGRSRITELESMVESIETKIKRAVDLMLETGSAAVKDRLSELEAEKEKLLYDIDGLRAGISSKRLSESEIRALIAAAKEQLKCGSFPERRKVISRFVDRVVVYDDKVEIFLKLAEGMVMKGETGRTLYART